MLNKYLSAPCVPGIMLGGGGDVVLKQATKESALIISLGQVGKEG